MTELSLRDDFVRNAYIYDVYDGDTVYYHADLGYSMWAAFQTGRLLYVNTPELRPLVSREAAERAKNFLISCLDQYALNRDDPATVNRIGRLFRIRSRRAANKWFQDMELPGQCKFGRWLIEIFGQDKHGQPVNINQLMLDSGHAEYMNYE